MKNCEWCKIEFEPAVKTRRFCGNKCSRLYANSVKKCKPKVVKTKVCPECKSLFTPNPSEFNRRIFCGRVCSTEHLKRERKGKPCKKTTVPLTSGKGRLSVYETI